MSWFRSKEEQLRENLYDEQVHAQVAAEIVANEIWSGLWAKAFAEANGNDVRAKAIYIRLRVSQIKLGLDAETEMVKRVERSLIALANQEKASTPPPPAVPSKQEFHMLTYEAQRTAISRWGVHCKVCDSNNLRAGSALTKESHFCMNCGKHRSNTELKLV